MLRSADLSGRRTLPRGGRPLAAGPRPRDTELPGTVITVRPRAGVYPVGGPPADSTKGSHGPSAQGNGAVGGDVLSSHDHDGTVIQTSGHGTTTSSEGNTTSVHGNQTITDIHGSGTTSGVDNGTNVVHTSTTDNSVHDSSVHDNSIHETTHQGTGLDAHLGF